MINRNAEPAVALFQGDFHDHMIQVVQRLAMEEGKRAFDCLTLFRHLMVNIRVIDPVGQTLKRAQVDIIMLSAYGVRVGAVQKWAHDDPDPLSNAITDWPKLQLLVRTWMTS